MSSSIDPSYRLEPRFPRPTVEKTRVLIAEEDGGLRAHLLSRLAGDGYQAIEARTVQDLLGQVRDPVLLGRSREPPDLVVLGARMGSVDGLKVLARLRRIAPQLPVVVVTDAGDARSVGVAQRLGAAAVLSKPLAPVRLLDTVRRLIAP